MNGAIGNFDDFENSLNGIDAIISELQYFVPPFAEATNLSTKDYCVMRRVSKKFKEFLYTMPTIKDDSYFVMKERIHIAGEFKSKDLLKFYNVLLELNIEKASLYPSGNGTPYGALAQLFYDVFLVPYTFAFSKLERKATRSDDLFNKDNIFVRFNETHHVVTNLIHEIDSSFIPRPVGHSPIHYLMKSPRLN